MLKNATWLFAAFLVSSCSVGHQFFFDCVQPEETELRRDLISATRLYKCREDALLQYDGIPFAISSQVGISIHSCGLVSQNLLVLILCPPLMIFTPQVFYARIQLVLSSCPSKNVIHGRPSRPTCHTLQGSEIRHAFCPRYHVIKMFSPFGKIKREEYLWHTHGPKKGEPRGYGFVEFATREVRFHLCANR